MASLLLATALSSAVLGARPAGPALAPSVHTFPTVGTWPTGISCVRQGLCLVVDRSGLLDLVSGTKSAQVAAAGFPLAAVSCSTQDFCMALGTGTAIELLPTTTHVFAIGRSSTGTDAVDWRWLSCPEPAFCMGGGYAENGPQKDVPVSATWNGLVWSRLAAIATPSSTPGPTVITTISCADRQFCVAAGVQGSMLRWNGTRWFRSTLPVRQDVFDVSCVSSTFCLAAGGSGVNKVYVWNGETWREGPVPSFPGGADTVSCDSPTFCVALRYDRASMWDGHSWSADLVLDPGEWFSHISCAAGYCEATENQNRYVYLDDPRDPPRLPAFCGRFACSVA